MANSYLQSPEIVIPANTSYYGNFPLKGGNLISAGFQNLGFTTKIYPTQLMITNNANVFFQIDNQNDFAVTAYIWGVADDSTASFGAITGQGSVAL